MQLMPPDAGPDALEGITVLDMTEGVAGPYATSLLGDLGANVIKIERPQGDWGRVTGAVIEPDFGSIFVAMNRNKRCVGLDVRSEAGKAIIRRMLPQCDVVISNYRRGVMEKLGFGYEDCVAIKPNLVYCTISAFDADGDWADAPGNDTGLQAASGLMSLSGMPDGEPLRTAVPVIDFTAGLFASQSVLAGLVRRNRPRRIEVSLLNVAAALQGIPLTEYLSNGVVPSRHGNQNPYIAPAGAYLTEDGKFITVSCLRQSHWVSLCGILGREDLLEDPRFADNTGRVANRPQLNVELDAVFATEPQQHWVDLLSEARLLHAAVQDFADLFANPGTGPTLPITSMKLAADGGSGSIGNPVRFDRRFPPAALPAPRRGEHSVEVLGEFGYTGQEIDGYLESGVVEVAAQARSVHA